MPQLVLFLCTGNYYRSRYAEALFNHRAPGLGLDWRAFSRGLAIYQAFGDISPLTEMALKRAGIPLSCTSHTRMDLREEDLQRADLTIALKEREHRSQVRERFPAWENQIEYWAVHDLDVWSPDEALPAIADGIGQLLDRLRVPAKAAGGQ